MQSTVRRPASDQTLTLREHLKLVLKPLGLAFTMREGFLMITSEESLDERPTQTLTSDTATCCGKRLCCRYSTTGKITCDGWP